MFRLNALSAEAIANPWQSSNRSAAAANHRLKVAKVEAPERWSWGQWRQRARRTLDRLDRQFRYGSGWTRYPSDRELRRLVKRGKLKVPQTLEEFEQLVAAAVGEEPAPAGPRRGRRRARPGGGPSGPERTAGAPRACSERADQPSSLEQDCRRRSHGSRQGAENAAPVKARERRPRATVQGPELTNDLRPPSSPGVQESNPGGPKPEAAENGQSSIETRQLAEALWQRANFFQVRAVELEELLEATLVWDRSRLEPLWWKLLPPRHAHGILVELEYQRFVQRRAEAARPGHEGASVAPGPPLACSPNSESRTGLRDYLLDWFAAVDHTSQGALLCSHRVEVALYDLAVQRCGIRREFLDWRPNLSAVQEEAQVQGQARRDRPEWQIRVVTADGETWVKLRDGRVFQPAARDVDGAAHGHPGVIPSRRRRREIS
jgi:hypothetical protein